MNVSVGSRPEDAPGDRLLDLQDGLAVRDRGDGDAQKRCLLDDLGGRVLGRPLADERVPLGSALLPGLDAPPVAVSSRSGRSISRQKESNCSRVLVLKPTQPSELGSIDGSSTVRAGLVSGGRPARFADEVGEVVAGEVRDLAEREVDADRRRRC